MRKRTLDLVVYAIPGAIFAVALVMGARLLWPDQVPVESSPATELQYGSPCAAGRYRCRAGNVEVMTGEEIASDSAPRSERCVVRAVSHCRTTCVSEAVTMTGVDELVARRQLCDPPADINSLVSGEQTMLDHPASDAEACDGDGYAPQKDRIVQCLLRSGLDPNATGMVLGVITCRHGVVTTLDQHPKLVKREQAIALWCARPPPELARAVASDEHSAEAGLLVPPNDAAPLAMDAGPRDSTVELKGSVAASDAGTLAPTARLTPEASR